MPSKRYGPPEPHPAPLETTRAPATRLHAAHASVTVLSDTAFVTDGTRRYVGPWWDAFEAPAGSVCAGPLVTADVHERAYADLAALTAAVPHSEAAYADARLLLARDSTGARHDLHPTQHQDLTDALLAGRREPLWEAGGKRERKVQVFPDQFAGWFGMQPATGGCAAAQLFPRPPRDVAGHLPRHTGQVAGGARTTSH